MKKIFLSLFCGMILLLSSCEKDFKEINTNPNKPETTVPYALFNGANKLLMDYTRYYTTSGKLVRSWMQYTAQATYTKESRFQYSDYSGDYIWRFGYQQAANYKDIIDLNTDPKTADRVALYGNNDNQIAAARIMMGYVFSMLAENFGDIPYYSWADKDNPNFQALQVNKYISPIYASQKDIYTSMLKDLKEAVDQIKMVDINNRPINYIFSSGDVLFRNPERMRRFGNSLRLRIAIHLSRVRDNDLRDLAIRTIREIVTDPVRYPVMQSNTDTIELPYENNDTNCSPIYRNYYVNRRTDYSPANTFVDFMKGTRGSFGQDPRLQKYFAPRGLRKGEVRTGSYSESTDINRYIGMTYGIDEEFSDSQFTSEADGMVSLFSHKILTPSYAEVFMEYSEVCFLLSEANFVLNGSWDDAKYREGVRASMEKWEVNSADISTFVNALPVANEENVITQKYAALYMNPNEAWTEYRRTGFPNFLIKHGQTVQLNNPINGRTTYVFTSLVPSLAQTGDLPERLEYPISYKLINYQNYLDALQAMGMEGEDSMAKKLIFSRQ